MTLKLNGTNSVAAPAYAGDDADTGLQCGTNELKLVTGGTARATVDSSGRLLVGTSTARTSLQGNITPQSQVEGTNANTSHLMLTRNDNGGSPGGLVLAKSRGTSVGSNTVVQSGDSLGIIAFEGSDGTDTVRAATILGQVDGTPGSDDMPGRLTFSTTADGASSPTERMRIRSDGNVAIGGTGSSAVRLWALASTTDSTAFAFAAYNASSQDLFFVRNDGAINTGLAALSPYNLTTAAAANVHIDTAGFLYRSTSSRRFKTSVETIQDSYSDAILNVEPVWYRSTAPGDTGHSDWSHYGFIAEDVAEIDPRLVFWRTHETEIAEDGTTTEVELDEPIAEGVQYDRFVPHLLNLIKRQQQAISTLEAKVAALEAAA